MRRWSWPRQFGDARRIFESGELNSGSASQLVSAVPVIRKYYQDIVAPVVANLGAASSCQDVIDLIEAACVIVEECANANKKGSGVTAASLHEKTFAFTRKYLRVYGELEADWTPKFHLSMHIALQWIELVREDKDAPLPNCFTLERKHKTAKKHMKDKMGGTSQERSVLEDMLLDQIWALNEGAQFGLIKPHAPTDLQREELEIDLGLGVVAAALVAAECRSSSNGTRFFNGDVVCTMGTMVGAIQRFVVHGGQAFARVAVWRLLSWNAETRTGMYDTRDARVEYVPCLALTGAAIFTAKGLNRTCIW
jgi:hypothetical protein